MTLDEARQRATLTVPEAAPILGVSVRSAYAAAAAGEIPVRRLGKRLLIPVPALFKWLGAEIDVVHDANGAGP